MINLQRCLWDLLCANIFIGDVEKAMRCALNTPADVTRLGIQATHSSQRVCFQRDLGECFSRDYRKINREIYKIPPQEGVIPVNNSAGDCLVSEQV